MSTTTPSPFAVFLPTTLDKSKPFDARLGITITKVDKEKRIVHGRATAEVKDAHGQIVDYETVKKAFDDWKGNIREMHQAKAVGRKVDMEFSDATKEVFVSSYISKGAPDTWEKICDGTLGEYSIGGRFIAKVEKVDGQPVEKLYATRMNELSVVDAGACPGCAFEIVKMDGETPVEAQTLTAEDDEADPVATPNDAAPVADPAPVEDPAAKVLATPALVRALVGTGAIVDIHKLDAIDFGTGTAIAKRATSYDVSRALSCIAYLQELVSSKVWQAQNNTDPLPAEDRAQLELVHDAGELLLAFLISEFMGQFPDDLMETAADETDEHMAKAIDAVRQRAALELRTSGGTLITKLHAALQAPVATLESTDTGVELTKLQGELSTTKAALTTAETTIRAQAESIVAVEKRLKTLEDSPLPGGPVVRAGAMEVRKQLGDQAAEDGEANPEEVVKALHALAASATSDAERTSIAEKLLAFQMKHGLGRTVITRQGA